ncbi:MAG: S8 family serine peptidase, partial [Pseudomonadota bacterium]
MPAPTDPLYASQWHFSLIGDVETIWDEFTGAGVTALVVDDGVDLSHPDLLPNYDASAHFFYDDPATPGADQTENNAGPAYPASGHGTNVAGILASANNSIGGVGVAYDITFTSLSIDDFFLLSGAADAAGDSALAGAYYSLFHASLTHAANFDIMSNSWGFSDAWQDYQNPTDPFSDVSLRVAGMVTATETGRDGLGTVVVLAAGNNTDNINRDGMDSARHVIGVAAAGFDGSIEDYSNWGQAVLITAPAASVTTDTTGPDGAEPGDYITTFGGTSSAAPVVSGVVALMLEANPNLGWRDVQMILAMSAGQTGEALDGTGGSTDEVGDWVFAPDTAGWSWNGGAMTYHLSYGFGMVDAFAAVRLAETWLTMTGEARTSANEVTVTVDYDEVTNGPVVIDDRNAGVDGLTTTTLTVMDDIQIETVEVTVSITYQEASDLALTLISPDGQRFELFDGIGGLTLMDNGWTWKFTLNGLMGVSSLGDWSLEFIDDFDDAETTRGNLDDWSITFNGSSDAEFYGTAYGEAPLVEVYDTDTFGPIDIFDARFDGTTADVPSLTEASVQVDTDIIIDSVTVTLTVESEFLGDLQFFLTGPDGSQYLIGVGNGGPSNGEVITMVDTLDPGDFIGQSSLGTWTLGVS